MFLSLLFASCLALLLHDSCFALALHLLPPPPAPTAAASQFPKFRETRAPTVQELLPYKDQIDEKYQFLLKAPVVDPNGLPSIIRYSRKTKEQYVRSEEDGKPSGWSAFYTKGKWVATEKGSK